MRAGRRAGPGAGRDGRLDLTLRAAAQDCVVLVVWDDADDDGRFDVTAQGRAAEPYGVAQARWG